MGVFFVQHISKNAPKALCEAAFFIARRRTCGNLGTATEGGIPGSPCSVWIVRNGE